MWGTHLGSHASGPTSRDTPLVTHVLGPTAWVTPLDTHRGTPMLGLAEGPR